MFYKQALLTITNYERIKAIKKVEDWDEEHFFYNPRILKQSDITWNLTKHCDDNKSLKTFISWEKL